MRHRRRRQGARWGDPAVNITPWQRFHRAIAPGSRRYGLVLRWRNWGVRIIGADCPGRCGAKGKDGCCGEHCGEARTCHSRTTHGSRSVSWKHWKWGRQSCRSTRLLLTEGAGCGAQVNAQPSSARVRSHQDRRGGRSTPELHRPAGAAISGAHSFSPNRCTSQITEAVSPRPAWHARLPQHDWRSAGAIGGADPPSGSALAFSVLQTSPSSATEREEIEG